MVYSLYLYTFIPLYPYTFIPLYPIPVRSETRQALSLLRQWSPLCPYTFPCVQRQGRPCLYYGNGLLYAFIPLYLYTLSLSPYLPISLSPYLPISLSPYTSTPSLLFTSTILLPAGLKYQDNIVRRRRNNEGKVEVAGSPTAICDSAAPDITKKNPA